MLPTDALGAPLSLACFDPAEELVWSASGSGMIYSHLLPTVEPYSAFRTDEAGSPALGLFPNPFGLIALTHDAVCFFSKGGMSQGPPVKLPELAGATCGCLVTSSSSSRLGIVSVFDPQKPTLSLLDLNTATVSATLAIDGAHTLARFDPSSNLVCVTGADGTISAYDVRGNGGRPAGKCPLFPSKAQMVCAIDLQGTTVVASALRSQLGPLGQNEFVFDTSLRTMDLRSMRPSADIYCAQGAISLKWYYGDGTGRPQILAASASGDLHLLDARGGMTAPTSTQLSLPERGEQLCSLDVSATSQLIVAGGSGGSLTVCAREDVALEALISNWDVQPPDLPDRVPEPPFRAMDVPVGALPIPHMPPPAQEAERPSTWSAKLIGKRGVKKADPELYLKSLNLPPPQHVSLGGVAAAYYRNTVHRPLNLKLPEINRRNAKMGGIGFGYGEEEEEPERIDVPEEWQALRRMVVPLGKVCARKGP